MDNILRHRIKGYMSVEASFNMPLIIMVLVIIIYWTFFLYNNCVVYQDCYIAALRGCQQMDTKESQIQNLVVTYSKELLNNQLFQYQNEPKVSVGAFSIKVSAYSKIDNQVSAFILKGNKLFETNREAISRRLDPVKYVRLLY